MGSLIPYVATIHPVPPRQIESLPIRANSSSSALPRSPPGGAIHPEEPMQRLIMIRRHMDSHEKPYKCPYPKCQRQRHINGFSRQDNLQVHINTYHKGKGKGTQHPSGVAKKQRIRRQGQMEMLKNIMSMSRKLLKQLEGDNDADSVLADEGSDEDDDEDSCDYD